MGAVNEPPGIELTVPEIVAMEGQTSAVDVSIVRKGGFDADVTLTLEGLPAEISAKPGVVIPSGQSGTKLEFTVKAAAKHGSRTGIVLRATSEDVSADAPVTLLVRGKPGSRDTSFGADGMTPGLTSGLGAAISETPRVAVLRDGKIVLASTVVTRTGNDEQFFAARVTERGALDPTFAGIGSIRFGTKQIDLRGLAVQADGKLILCGAAAAFSTVFRGVVSRLSVEGNPDSSFGTLGEALFSYPSSEETGFNDCAMLPSGNIAVTGVVKGASSLLFGQLSTSGALVNDWGDPAGFRVQGAGSGSQLVLLPDGRYLAAVSSPNGVQLLGANGRDIDSGFGTAGRVSAPANLSGIYPSRIARHPDGRFVLAAIPWSTTSDNGFTLLRYLPSGQPDTSFGTAGALHLFPGKGARPYELLVQPDGKLLLTCIHSGDGAPGYAIMRLLSDGKPDSSFGENGVLHSEARMAGLALDSMQRIVVAAMHNQDFKVLRFWN